MIFILNLPSFVAPLSNSETSEDGVRPSQRSDLLIIIDWDTLVMLKLREESVTPTLTNKKGKEKDKMVVISMSGLISSTSNFTSVMTSFTLEVTPRKSRVEGGWDLASPYMVHPCLHTQWSHISELVRGGGKDFSQGVNKPVRVGPSRLLE